MAMAISIQCSVRCSEQRAYAKRPRNMRRAGVRLAAFAVAAAAVAVMSYGEHWLLQQAPATASELVAATYAVDALSGGAVVVDADAKDIRPNANEIRRDDRDIAR